MKKTAAKLNTHHSVVNSQIKSIWSSKLVAGVLIGCLTNFIYDRIFSFEASPTVLVFTDEIVVEQGNKKVIVSRKSVVDGENPSKSRAIKKSLAYEAKNIETEMPCLHTTCLNGNIECERVSEKQKPMPFIRRRIQPKVQ